MELQLQKNRAHLAFFIDLCSQLSVQDDKVGILTLESFGLKAMTCHK